MKLRKLDLIPKKDKKGTGIIAVVIFFFILFAIVMVGFIASIGTGLLDLLGDEITPIMLDIGVIDGTTNVSEYAEYTFVPLNNVLQSLKWLVGIGYLAALLISVFFAVAYSQNPHPIFIGLYFAMIVMLVFGAMYLSNMYQQIFEGTDDLAVRMQEQSILSYMIIYAPLIMTIIGFITGLFFFIKGGEPGI